MNIRNVLVGSALALLGACGGGGDDSSSGGAGGGGTTGPSLSLGPSLLEVTAANTSTAAPTATLTFTVSNLPDAGVYLGGSHTVNGMYEATVAVTSDTGGQINVRFRDPVTMDPGVYTDTLKLKLCSDEGCNSVLAERQVTSHYTVTGTVRPKPAITLSTTTVFAQSLPFGPPTTASITVSVTNISPQSVGFAHLERTNNAILDTSFWVNGTDTGIFTITFKEPASLGRGTYDDTITLNACDNTTYDCQWLLQGPQTISVRYVVSDTISGPNGYTVKFINQSANDLAWDPGRERIYYSQRIAANAGAGIGVVNPALVSHETTHGMSAETNILALSADGQYLYAGDDAGSTVQQLSLPSFSTTGVLSLGSSPDGPLRALDIQPAPAQSNTVAIAIGKRPSLSSNCHAIDVFDGVVARSVSTLNMPEPCSSSLQWGSANLLYANDIGSFPTDLNTLTVDGAGVHPAVVYPATHVEFITRIQLAGDRIYSDRGAVFNTVTSSLELPFTLPMNVTAPSAVADPSINRFFVLWSPTVGSSELIAYDLASRQEIARLPLNGVNTMTGRGVVRLIRWGGNGLAFVTADDRIVLISGPFVAP